LCCFRAPLHSIEYTTYPWGNVGLGEDCFSNRRWNFVRSCVDRIEGDGLAVGLKKIRRRLIKKEGQKTGFQCRWTFFTGWLSKDPINDMQCILLWFLGGRLENTKPDLNIFDYKNGNSINQSALLNLTNTAGEFFLKWWSQGMSYFKRISAVDIAIYMEVETLLRLLRNKGECNLITRYGGSFRN
jgi:hypothetical protein